jgi:pimeloyl-ACP methyl ester carboxylesterase
MLGMTVSADRESRSRIARAARVFTPGRIVALVLIAVVVAGLAYLRFALDADTVAVPRGAKAGDLILERCDYGTEDGSYEADCGTLVVPENRHKAGARLIALPVTRIRARSGKASIPIFRLQGGPGLTNMDFARASWFADKHDVVLVGYRGVDGSSKLDCPEVTSARAHSRDFLSEKSFRADAAAYKDCAKRLQEDGVDLAGYTLPQRVEDLDAVRRALGYERIDLLSESAGTRTAMIYAWRYPQRIHRSVMIGANPPGNFLLDAKTIGDQVGRYAVLCANDVACRSRTTDLAASIHSAYEHMPDRWWFLPIKEGHAEVGAVFSLVNVTTDAAGLQAAPWTIDTLIAADEVDGSGAWFLSLLAQLIFPRVQVWGEVAAVGRSDAAYGRRFFATQADRGSVIGSPGTDYIWAGGRLLDAWPASRDENQYTRVQDSNVETLLIGGELDFATPPQKATRELLPHLPNGHEVVLPNLGHSDDFWTYQSGAGTRLVNTFLDSGRVDTSLYTPTPVDFTPAISHGTIAEITLGVMLALAALALLSLAWMALRVRRRGAFGRKASVALRSLFPVVLGLGGWFIGVLVVLATMPGTPLLDEWVTSIAVGLPIGLGIYLAWVDRDWTSTTRFTGLAATAGGALIGAWLGFNVTSAGLGLFAPLLTIVGAAVGANLTLLALDIAWEWLVRNRSAVNAKETLETTTAPG